MTASSNELNNFFSARIRPWLVRKAAPFFVGDEIHQGVYIYGAGELGGLALEYCEACDIPVLGILDRNRSGHLQSNSGNRYEISSPDSKKEPLDKNVHVAVAIATLPYGSIRDQLYDYGWRHVIPFYSITSVSRKGHPLQNGWVIGNVTDNEVETVEWVCEHWVDEKSWRHFEAFVAWHSDNFEVELAEYPIEPDERYAIPELLDALANRQNQFVDIGSHRGESVSRLTNAGLHFREYLLFEPDAISRAHLLTLVNEMQQSGRCIAVLKDVLGAVGSSVTFQTGLGYCSQCWSEGTERRKVTRLDALNLTPDFIKVHTEGTELEILEGARGTISRTRPCVAFSIYHRREGLFRDIAEAMKMFSDYQWFFRMHSYQGTGAFVYAIPNQI